MIKLLPLKFKVFATVGAFFAISLTAFSQGPPPAPVSVVPVKLQDVSEDVELVGTASPQRKSRVAAKVEGRVEKLFVDEGDEIKSGDPLARLDSSELELQLKAAKASLQELKVRHQQALSHEKRFRILFNRGRISEEQYQDSQYDSQALLHQQEELKAEMERLKDLLAKKTITAPFSGVVVKKLRELGEWVSVGGELVELVDLQRVQVKLELPERYLPVLDREGLVNVRPDALPQNKYLGKILAVIPEADPKARTVTLKIDLDNSHRQLHAQMFVRAQVPLKTLKKAKLVPKDALINRGPVSLVFVVQENRVQEVPVQVKGYYGSDAEVEGNLLPDQLIVVRGNERLFNGQSVQVAP